ncbi:MAG: radical SAM protein [Candidatus Wallbacteria bacterium]|nr:radical SAM protein [Candidatus Wallbacteria bacterium]
MESVTGKEKRLLPVKRSSVFRATIFYPNSYHVAMSSLAVHGLLRITNEHPNWTAERYFADTGGKYTLDNQQLVSDSDIIAVTVSYEPDIERVLRFLSDFAIPLDPKLRHSMQPVIIAGGAVTYHNTALLSSFADLVAVGDGEELYRDLLTLFPAFRGKRRELWEHYRLHPHVVTPLDATAKKPVIKSVTEPWHSAILARDTEFSDMFLIEIGRGCPHACPFCTVGANFGPVRWFDSEKIAQAVSRAGCRRVGLVAPSPLDHPQIHDLLSKLDGYDVRCSSVRLDSVPEELPGGMVACDSLTVGLESGSLRLRLQIGKNTDDGIFLDRLRTFYDQGVRKLKLYAMYGLPGETDADLCELMDLVRQVCSFWNAGKITVSLNAFAPMPGTAWEDHPFDLKFLRKKERILRDVFRRQNLSLVRLDFEPARNMALQFRLAHGGLKEIREEFPEFWR